MRDGLVTFGRLAATYLVPRGHPAPDALRRRGDEALRDHLAPALAAQLARIAPNGDESVRIIRDLRVDFPFAGEHVGDLSRVWADEIVRSLLQRLRSGDGVATFPSRAAFVAQYVSDLALGRDCGCWYYAQFDSLRALPRAAAIREAIVREPDHAAAIVFELARSQRFDAVVAALNDRGAQAIYDAVFPESSEASPSPRMIELLLAHADALDSRDLATPRNALRLAVALAEAGASAARSDVRAHVDHLLRFASLLAESREPWRLVEAIHDGDSAAAIALARSPAIETLRFFTALGALRPDLLTCAASTLMPRSDDSRQEIAERVGSRYAGLALLLPSLIDLDLFGGDAARDAALRTMVAMKCAGGAFDVAGDPVARLFAGTEHRVGSEELDALGDVDALTTDAASAVMTSFASRLFGFGGSSFAYLYENFCAGNGAIAEERDRFIVDLPPVPLEMILRMAGFHDRTIAPPWLAGRVVVLRLGAFG